MIYRNGKLVANSIENFQSQCFESFGIISLISGLGRVFFKSNASHNFQINVLKSQPLFIFNVVADAISRFVEKRV